MADGLLEGLDGRLRCAWAGSAIEYLEYHDTEWGVPVHDDRLLFEFLTLEGAQAVQWESNGSPEFTISEIEKDTRGTDIVLYINEESVEFLEKSRIQGILDKYCKFLPVPIKFGTKSESVEDGVDDKGEKKWKSVEVDNIINTTSPICTSCLGNRLVMVRPTIIRISSLKATRGFHPSFFLALLESATRRSTSAGLKSLGSCTT